MLQDTDMTSSQQKIAPAPSKAPDAVKRMTAAANTFLNTLNADQRATATFPFAGDERYVWNYTPVERNGLRARNMSQEQLDAAKKMMDTAYSDSGRKTAHQIIELETILGEWEEMQPEDSHWERHPDRYWFSVFGTPGSSEPWGFRVGGHHIGLFISIVNNELVSFNPIFFGANPAEVRHGEQKGMRTLPFVEDAARSLVKSLSVDQRKVAVVDPVAPSDILTKNYRVADPSAAPSGIPFRDLSDSQKGSLVGLVRHYVGRAADDLAANYWTHIETVGTDRWSFAWAGPLEPGQGHYYAITAPNFVVEYDNTQNGANHIHSVLRDYANDWGEDILAAHYHHSSHHNGH